MAIIQPSKYTQVLVSEVTYLESVEEDTVNKMIQNINLLSKLAPVGTIRAININQNGTPSVNTDIWQLCDGSEITNGNSPLRSTGLTQRFTPDLRSKFVRGAATTSANSSGGSPTVNLQHNHGRTGGYGGPVVSEEGDEKVGGQFHDHGIPADLNAAEPLFPAYHVIAWYIKIV